MSTNNLNLNLIPLHKNAENLIPFYGTQASACFDIKADIETREISFYTRYNVKQKVTAQPFIIEPYSRVLIPTGFIFVIPDGYSMRLHPRSGYGWKHGITLMNSEGIIDSDYPNETFVMLHNTTSTPFPVVHGDRVAQAELVKRNQVEFNVLPIGAEFSQQTDRVGGFGSTS